MKNKPQNKFWWTCKTTYSEDPRVYIITFKIKITSLVYTSIARNDRFCTVWGECNDNDPEFVPSEERQCATASSWNHNFQQNCYSKSHKFQIISLTNKKLTKGAITVSSRKKRSDVSSPFRKPLCCSCEMKWVIAVSFVPWSSYIWYHSANNTETYSIFKWHKN